MKFIRANNADGTSWGSPQTVDNNVNKVGEYNSLAIVNGYPAISYYDGSVGKLNFIRATDANGTSWGTPQLLDDGINAGQDTSLAVVNGMPAISYYDLAWENLKFVRANDADGTSWGTPQDLNSGAGMPVYTLPWQPSMATPPSVL